MGRWLFPRRPGKHINPRLFMRRLRALGIDPLGARNSALPHLVTKSRHPSSPTSLATATKSLTDTPN